MTYKLLSCSLNHPDSKHPYRGLFNKRALQAVADLEECLVTAFAPIPYVLPFGPKSDYWHVPIYEQYSSYGVIRPRFVYFVPKSLLYTFTGESYRKTLEKAAAGVDFDIAHGWHIFPDGYGLLSIAEEKKRPFTVTSHGHFINNIDNLPPRVQNQVQRVLLEANRVICVSEALANKAASIDDNIITTTIPIGANPDNFPTEKNHELRNKYDIPVDSQAILFCGQFIERKGVLELIDILSSLPMEGVEYIFIGHGGDLKNHLINEVEKLPQSGKISILDSVATEELREWFAIADLLLLPSHEEGRPTVIYEAMASRTAVLSTDIEGVNEQVVDGETGVLISPRSSSKLEREIRELVEDPGKLEIMGKNGFERLVENNWTWKAFAKELADVHSEILSQ